MSLVFKDKMTLREVREFVCTKRAVPPENFVFQHLDDHSTNTLSVDLTLMELGEKVNAIKLLDRKCDTVARW